jgi:hypothetical protein
VREPGRIADRSAALSRISVEIGGVDALHAPFFTAYTALSSAAWLESGPMTKWSVVSFIRDRQLEWTEKKQQVPSTSLRSEGLVS